LLLDVDTAVGEARALHSNNQGYFAIFRKTPESGRGIQNAYSMSDLDDVVARVQKAPDVYLSQSSFVRKSRRISALGQMGCAFVDIDCYKLGIRPDEQFALDLVDKATCYGIPTPSYIISSGRGLYLKWLFTRPVSAANLYRWDALQRVLISLYHAIGADMAARDASRVLRVVGSTNSASGGASVGPVWNGGQRYDFESLSADAAAVDLPHLQLGSSIQIRQMQSRVKKLEQEDPVTARETAQQQRAVLEHLNNFAAQRRPVMFNDLAMGLQQLNWRRFLDLRDLSIMRGGVKRGSRDLTLFWMGTFLAHAGVVTPDNFESEMGELASGFPGTDFKPMQDQSLSTLLDKVRAKQRGEKVVFNGHVYGSLYTPTNAKLIDIFEITPQEQAGLSTIIDGSEKLSRSDAKVPGRSDRRAERAEWRFKASFLAEQAKVSGHEPCITEIAEQVGVHKAQVSRLLSGQIGGPRKPRPRKVHTVVPVQPLQQPEMASTPAGTAAPQPTAQPTPVAVPSGAFYVSRTVFLSNPFKARRPGQPAQAGPPAPVPQNFAEISNPLHQERAAFPPPVADFAVSREGDPCIGDSDQEDQKEGFPGARPPLFHEMPAAGATAPGPVPSIPARPVWPTRQRPSPPPASAAAPPTLPVARPQGEGAADADLKRFRDEAVAAMLAIKERARASRELEEQLRNAEREQQNLRMLNKIEHIRRQAARLKSASTVGFQSFRPASPADTLPTQDMNQSSDEPGRDASQGDQYGYQDRSSG